MQDLRSLFNQALSVVGSDPVVTDPNAATKAVTILQLWYPVARRAVFSSAHWPDLRSHSRLALIATRDPNLTWTSADPAPEFQYAFAYPTEMILPQYMQDFSRFSLSKVGSQKAINSNNLTPILCYSKDNDDPGSWDPDLYMCVVWSLAACINMAKNGQMALTQKLERQVTDLIAQTFANAANSDDTYYEAMPSFWAGTGFTIPGGQTQFIYPTSSFLLSGLTQ